ncbi:hypothetical protein [Allosalinactinospora lopnorensis]|uniref:hypothetical protein n=1 Tax=Allosalinactinospora lopnorensis TaxID=1352348 RepID=UPI000623EAB5|nr:hypothetical protein [Allosalinactinospora lopnorensis]
MGSGGKTTHQTYQTAPTAAAIQPEESDPVPPSGESAEHFDEGVATAAGASGAEDIPLLEEESDESSGSEVEEQAFQQEPEDAAPAAEENAEALADLYIEPPPDVVTPIPQTPPEGAAAGVPVLVGGADLVDSTATLVSYTDPEGKDPREVLLTTLNEQAEDKLLEALAVNEPTLVPTQVEEEVTGRLPVDEDKQLYELVAKVAKSVNHKLKNNEVPIPQHTKEYLATAQTAIQEVWNNPESTQAELTMAAYYSNWLGDISHKIDTAGAQPYDEGGKVPFVSPYEHSGTTTVTKMVPAPEEDPGSGLSASIRDASRIHPQIDTTTGTTSWDGKSRSKAWGKEYLIDMGEGWSAVYRPYSLNDPSTHEYTLRGQLEVHAPQGAGNGEEMVRRLGDLHLVNRAMTHAEGEWTYLKNNIEAQKLGSNPKIKKALNQANALEEAQLQELFHTHAHQAVGLDQDGLTKLAKEWQIEASAACLPAQVKVIREAVAQATGHTDGAGLAASPGYDPAPRASGGWLTWGRFDVGNQQPAIESAWKGRSLVHEVSGGNLAELLATGVLASTERRSAMGITSGKGMSEGSDKMSGGANSVFTRVRKTSSIGPGARLVWDDPPRLLNNTSIYGYNSDHFGALNPEGHHSMNGLTKDPMKMADFNASDNEIMFRNGLDLLGAEAPSRILCGSAQEKQQVLSLLKKRGITHLAGKPVDQVVK